MDAGYTWLKSIADRMQHDVDKGAAAQPERLTVRELLAHFDYARRSNWINKHIQNGLEKFKLRTDEDVTVVWLDSTITIELDANSTDQQTHPERAREIQVAHRRGRYGGLARLDDYDRTANSTGASEKPRTSDPTHRVSALPAANRVPASVKPESPLCKATTIMQMNGYSRLPVMKNERDVAGIVTWESIGTRLALGRDSDEVGKYMEPAEVIPGTHRLFDAIGIVTKHGYVLVRGTDRTITGMVTVTDLTDQLGQFAGPFLFVGEIEGHLRNLIHGKFTLDQLQAASHQEEAIEGSSDLTFGGFCRLLENRANWRQLNLDIDRAEFVEHLNSVRKIRNNVMHFTPDGIDKEQRKTLRNVARFFDKLARVIAA